MIHYHFAFRFSNSSTSPSSPRYFGEVLLPASMKLLSVKLDEPNVRVMALRVRRASKIVVSPVVDGVAARDLMFMSFGFELAEGDRLEMIVEPAIGHTFSPGPHGLATLSGPFGLVMPGAL